MSSIRTAIVGLGAISFEHLAKLSRRTDVEVVGLCDLHDTLAQAVAERFGQGVPYTDYERMLVETRPDVVHVLTPPQAHRELALGAFEAGAHVFVEKPIAPTWSEYTEMRDAAAERNLLLCENYNYRFMPGVLAAHEAWRSGQIGEVVNVDVSFGGVMDSTGPYADRDIVHFAHSLPGGALQNFVSHPVSLALSFTQTCTSVVAVERQLNGFFASSDELRAILDGPRGCAVVTVSSHASPPHLTLAVGGTQGSLDVDVYTGQMRIANNGSVILQGLRDGARALQASATMTSRALTGRRDGFEGLGTLLDRFYGAVANDGASPVSVAEMDGVNGVVRDLFQGGEQR